MHNTFKLPQSYFVLNLIGSKNKKANISFLETLTFMHKVRVRNLDKQADRMQRPLQ